MSKLELRCVNGSLITVCTESNKDNPDFLEWSVGPNSMFGTCANGAELRIFLRKVLAHMERDQIRLNRRRAKIQPAGAAK